MAGREVAWRVFAGEYNESDLEYRDNGDMSPNFVVSPLGARMNRLFVVGVLTSTENVGEDGGNWRGQITDPTGVFYVYAGQYEPEAANALSELEPPAVVAVVGKSRTYTPEEGGRTYTSIRPEVVKKVEVGDRNRWIMEAAQQTKARLEAVQTALEMDEPTADELVRQGVDRKLAEGIARALDHYGSPPLERYVAMVEDALETLLPGDAELKRDFAPATDWDGDDADVDGPDAGSDADGGTEADDAEEPSEAEDTILELVGTLDEDDGAPWEEIVAAAEEEDIAEEEVEEALNNLMDRGLIFEPVLGRLKQT